MSSQPLLTLYDLPTKKPQYGCWSPNVWKTRLVLNYKRIPYQTTWLEHSAIAPTLEAEGLAPNPPRPQDHQGPWPSPYTVPAVLFPDGTAAMDSALIAPELEKRYPKPSLHLENGLHDQALAVLGQVGLPLLAITHPRIHRDILLDSVKPDWKARKEAQFGMTLEDLEAQRGGEVAWKAAAPGFRAVSEFLRAHKVDEGPFLLGSQVCYGDFILASMLECFRRLGEDLFERVVAIDGKLGELHEACKPWMENDR